MFKYIMLLLTMLATPMTLASMDDTFDDFDDTLFIEIVESNLGDTLQVDFVVFSCEDIAATQWTIDYNSKIELIEVEKRSEYQVEYADFGAYTTFSWFADAPNYLNLDDGEILFTMKFIANGEEEANVAFSNVPTPIEVFNSKEEQVLLVPSRLSSDNATILSATFYIDDNSNCSFDEGEATLPNLLFTLNGGFTLKTNDEGNVTRFLKPNEYTINLLDNSLWSLCEDQTVFTIDESSGHVQEKEIAVQPIVNCSSAEISAAAPFLRRCVDNTYFFTYCNIGTQVIEDPEISISYPEAFIYKGANISQISNEGAALKIEGEKLGVGECKNFHVIFEPICEETALGETYCVEASISPAELCTESSTWSGADLEVRGRCVGDEVVFSIKNKGGGDMNQPLSFIVIEDDVMIPFPDDEDDYEIESEDSISVVIPAKGKTYRMVAEQEPNHPFPGSPTFAIERCGEGQNGEVSLGYINQFEEGDQAPSTDVFCTEIIGSFDPNDKQGFPRGYGVENYVLRETQMEYLIRFQNTGNDTAFNVFIEDSIHHTFDLSTIQVGPASHRFTWEVKNERTLVFYFDDILLPDSTTNERESNGFIKYKIQQSTDNQEGMTLENQASIFFDFNEPIITNTTKHLIGNNFIISNVIPSLPLEGSPYNVYPNPTNSGLWIEQMKGKENAVLTLFSYDGRLILNRPINHQLNFIDRRDLSEGLNFYTIATAEGKTYSGKITVVR